MGSTCISSEEENLIIDDTASMTPTRAWLTVILLDFSPGWFLHPLEIEILLFDCYVSFAHSIRYFHQKITNKELKGQTNHYREHDFNIHRGPNSCYSIYALNYVHKCPSRQLTTQTISFSPGA